jgi:hypothetical protein
MGNGTFHTKVFLHVVLPGFFLLALMVFFPTFVGAAGDSEGDAKLQAMKMDIMACMQPGVAGQAARAAFSKKYNVPLSNVNENTPNHPPASNGAWDYDTAKFVCTLEYLAFVGTVVWGAYQISDGCYGNNSYHYCISYSQYCDHYDWHKSCLSEKCPSCCKKE